MPVLLAFTGQRTAGKNLAASAIAELCDDLGLSFAERGFADLLKWSAMRIFFPDIGREDAIGVANVMKFQGDISATPFGPAAATPELVTGRQYLQRYGTESHRDIFGENFWVDQLLPSGHHLDFSKCEPYQQASRNPINAEHVPKWYSKFDNADVCVINDLRFENEAERVLALGGSITRIERPSLPEPDDHLSETPLNPRYVNWVVQNKGTKADFIKTVKNDFAGELEDASAR